MFQSCDPNAPVILTGGVITQTTVIACMCAGLLVTGRRFLQYRREAAARLTVVVVGGGPSGLLVALIAAAESKVTEIRVYEEKSRMALFGRQNQVAFDAPSMEFLRGIGVDFNNIEGCYENGCFFTRVGVFLEYLFCLGMKKYPKLHFYLDKKFSTDALEQLESVEGRVLAVACDGVKGRGATLLGLSDEFTADACSVYAATAAMDRHDRPLVPAPETRVHNIKFDLSAYGYICTEKKEEMNHFKGFHLKLFGTHRHRYMSLVSSKADNRQIRTMKMSLDQGLMRNVFLHCFNTYKDPEERVLDEKSAIRSLKYSKRLFEVKLLQRRETVAYVEDADIFVLAEGEAVRSFNFQTGMGINMVVRSLRNFRGFLASAAVASTEEEVVALLQRKQAETEDLNRQLIKSFLHNVIFK